MASVQPVQETTNPRKHGLDANVYATKKTIAQGMLDVALLTANASQLKYLLQLGTEHEFYYLMVTLISLSLVLQIAIGVLILIKSQYNVNDLDKFKKATVINNIILWFIFGVTVINVFISAFGIDPGLPQRKFQRTDIESTINKNYQPDGYPRISRGFTNFSN